jgi:hypothetical protein
MPVPDELAIKFHNAAVTNDTIELESPEDYDCVVKIARAWARKTRRGVRTSRKELTFSFTSLRQYQKDQK